MLDKYNQSSPRVIQDISCLPLVRYKGTPARIRMKLYFTPAHLGDNYPFRTLGCFYAIDRLLYGQWVEVPCVSHADIDFTQSKEIESSVNQNGWSRPYLAVANP